MDKSNGYEAIATAFIKGRGQAYNGIGTSTVRNWVRSLKQGSTVLDLGCGTGIPVSKLLIDAGMLLYGVDASKTLVKAFKQHFPNAPIECEAAEESFFFNRKFDAIIAWGLLFLMPMEAQTRLIQKASDALDTGAKFLFTAPSKKIKWNDAMTGQESRSLGADKYKELLSASGLSLIEEFEDEGGNHYYHSFKN